MKLLLDTHLLLWAATTPDRLSRRAREYLDHPEAELLFSVASIWEVAIKFGKGRNDFKVDPRLLQHGLIDFGMEELEITGSHACAVAGLPRIHHDPFDRLLVAQAIVEAMTLLTSDQKILRYEGPIELV